MTAEPRYPPLRKSLRGASSVALATRTRASRAAKPALGAVATSATRRGVSHRLIQPRMNFTASAPTLEIPESRAEGARRPSLDADRPPAAAAPPPAPLPEPSQPLRAPTEDRAPAKPVLLASASAPVLPTIAAPSLVPASVASRALKQCECCMVVYRGVHVCPLQSGGATSSSQSSA